VRLQQPGRAGGPAALVADPQLTPGAVTPVCDPRDSGPVRQAGLWQPLPCTALEARQLMPLLQVPRPLTGVHASVANVVAAQRPRILHIASHGFFWSEAEAREQATACSPAGGSAAPAAKTQVSPSSSTVPGPSGAASRAAVARPQPGTSTGAGGPSLIQSFEALQRSGIVLAGANQPCRAPEQDGYLTAAEVTGMDLEGTELTTLSACQTGLGDVRSGEGVYGLQRALAVAGSRSSLLTLWKVGDAGTQEFMAEYYRRLERGEGRAEALAATQAFFRRHTNEEYRHVYWWGAFQLSGDWRPLPRW